MFLGVLRPMICDPFCFSVVTILNSISHLCLSLWYWYARIFSLLKYFQGTQFYRLVVLFFLFLSIFSFFFFLVFCQHTVLLSLDSHSSYWKIISKPYILSYFLFYLAPFKIPLFDTCGSVSIYRHELAHRLCLELLTYIFLSSMISWNSLLISSSNKTAFVFFKSLLHISLTF